MIATSAKCTLIDSTDVFGMLQSSEQWAVLWQEVNQQLQELVARSSLIKRSFSDADNVCEFNAHLMQELQDAG